MTLEMAVAPIALALANHPDLESYDLSSLRYIMWGATPVTESVAEAVTARTGVRWLPAYGASELPVIACNPVDDPAAWRLDSAGLPPAGVELRVADLDKATPTCGEDRRDPGPKPLGGGGLPARLGQRRRLRRRLVPHRRRRLPRGRGWVRLTDRSKEMIKVKGFQVAPAEIEAVLHGHPSVLDCAVFGVADEQAGEVPVAAVQLDPAHPATDGELRQLVADSLATYKQVREVVIVEHPGPSGKVLRHASDGGRPASPPGGWADGRPPLRRAAGPARLGGQVVGRLGPHAVGDLDDASRPTSSTPQ